MKKVLYKNFKIIKKEIFKNMNVFEKFSFMKFLYFFPFLFGIGHSLYEQYKNKSFYFISQNIYLRNTIKEEPINWETFNFFIKKNIKQKNIDNFSVYKNILFLDLNKSFNLEFFGIIKTKKNLKKKYISNKYFLIKSRDIFF
jgi:hypothetical protein